MITAKQLISGFNQKVINRKKKKQEEQIAWEAKSQGSKLPGKQIAREANCLGSKLHWEAKRREEKGFGRKWPGRIMAGKKMVGRKLREEKCRKKVSRHRRIHKLLQGLPNHEQNSRRTINLIRKCTGWNRFNSRSCGESYFFRF